MYPVLIVIGLIVSANAALESSSQNHSTTYAQWKAGTFNRTFFLPETFLSKHRCMALSENGSIRRRQFLQLLQSEGVTCQGDWCIDNKFKCDSGNSKSCYNLEHIIDLKNSILPHWNKNIAGNIVMAYGKWNQEMGQLTWPMVELEKREIYGNDLVNRAILNLQFCHLKHSTPVQEILDDDDSEDIDLPIGPSGNWNAKIGWILGGLILILIIVAIIMGIKYLNSNRPNQIQNNVYIPRPGDDSD